MIAIFWPYSIVWMALFVLYSVTVNMFDREYDMLMNSVIKSVILIVSYSGILINFVVKNTCSVFECVLSVIARNVVENTTKLNKCFIDF